MFNMKKSIAAVAVAASLGMGASAYAGNNDGGIVVSVSDGSEAPLSNVSIVIRNSNTGFRRTVTTDSDGNLRVGLLPVGVYEVVAEKDGYDTVSLGEVTVRIGQNTNVNLTLYPDNVETISVTGSAIASIDFTSTESALNISAVELDRLPVPRSVTSVALLAPGTTQGDNRFGGVSFGGSSVAENQVYINGLNVTNFRNGLGFSNPPYEFYDQFQVKTGGYSAEFGRSTGGVINAVVKSGTNEFHAGASAYVVPSDLREQAPSVFEEDGSYYTYRDNDKSSTINYNVWASGALIEDTLFFYALYNPRDVESRSDRTLSDGNLNESNDDNAFWGVKLDWNITDNHRLELLTFSDDSENVTDIYNVAEDGAKTRIGSSTSYSGGTNWSLKYIGYLTDDLTVSAMYGENKYDLTTATDSSSECELALDYRYYYGFATDIPGTGVVSNGCATTSNYFLEEGEDTREAMRIDFDWAVSDDHLLRFGMDNETNTSFSNQFYSGPRGTYWLIYPGFDGETVNDVVLDADTDYAMGRTRTVGGNFETEASAFYIEDTWTVTDEITLTLGLRNEQFDNKNAAGETFAKIDNMWAPRLGFAWDIGGMGEHKVFASVGRYFLPVANNTNVRLAGNEADQRNYYVFTGWEEFTYNGGTYYTPGLGEQIGSTRVTSTGEVPDTRSIVSNNLDAMYQDEIIIGYQGMINEDWSWGIKGTQRQLNGAIDDMIIDHAIAERFGCGDGYHPNQYVLGNPGKSMEVYTDTDCDGSVDDWATFTAEELVYPEAERTYYAVDLNIAKAWDGVWSLDATYTWSHSYGNSEGLVKSDNGQDDAGLTTDFDFPELMDGAYGNLPNDRRHMLKVFGSYAISENFTVGINYSLQSGRPVNAFGVAHPGPDGEVDYGYTYYLSTDSGAVNDEGAIIYDYEQVTRGSQGRTPWVSRVDVNLAYSTEIAGLDTRFKIDVFNLLDADNVTRINEVAESAQGQASPRYGLAQAFQTPRYVQISANVTF